MYVAATAQWIEKQKKTLHGFFVNQGIWLKCNYNIDQKE